MDRTGLTLKRFATNLLMCLFLITLAAGCATFENDTRVDDKRRTNVDYSKTTFEIPQDNNTSEDSEHFNTSYDVFPEYRVMPGDILEVFFKVDTGVLHEFRLETDYTIQIKFVNTPELNESQIVRPDGTIALPYLGDIKVIGKTVDELTAELKKAYSKIVKEPNLYILVPEFRTTLKEFKADLHTAPRGLSRLTTVRPDGIVTFPIIGEIFAAKKTLKEVNIAINTLYEKIIPGLHCNLFLEKQSGFLVYVFGEVRKPGAFPILKPISLLEALALSESFLPTAKTGSIVVLRKTKDKVVATVVNLSDVISTTNRTDVMVLNPDDVVYVPKRTLSTIADVMRDISDIVFFKGWSMGLAYQMYTAPTSTTAPKFPFGGF